MRKNLYKLTIIFIFLLAISPFLIQPKKEIKAFEGSFADKDIKTLVSINSGSDAVITEKGTLLYHSNEVSGIKYLNTLANDTTYAITVKYRHNEVSNAAMTISVTSDQYGYGLNLKVYNDVILEASGTANDRRNYSVGKAIDGTYIAKIFIWSGWESDWHLKLGATNINLDCEIYDMTIKTQIENNDNELYGKVRGLISDNAENTNGLGRSFEALNYTETADQDGRITTDANLVISGNSSYYATANNTLDWQPFIQSTKTLEMNKVYTVTFDYKYNGDINFAVNARADGGDLYRALYLNGNGFVKIDAGILDSQIGSDVTTGWHNYAENLRSTYVINKGNYYHVKFSFLCAANNTKISFNFAGSGNESFVIIDNISVYEGVGDLNIASYEMPSELTAYDKTSQTKVTLENNTITYVTNDECALKYLPALNNDGVYELTVKYSHTNTTNDAILVSLTSDQFGYGISFKLRGSEILECLQDGNTPYDIRNYEVVDNGDNTYVLKLYLWSGWEGDWRLKFGATSDNIICSILSMNLDYTGNTDDSEFYSTQDAIFYDDAEGNIKFNEFIPVNYREGSTQDSRITTDANLVISGNSSYYATANNTLDWQPFIISNKTMKAAKLYTLSFDYKHNGDLNLSAYVGTYGDYYRCMYLNSNGFVKIDGGILDSQAGTEATGWHDYSANLRSTRVVNKGNYYHVKFSFVCPMDGSQVKFNFAGGGNDSYAVIDNIVLREGNNEGPYNTIPLDDSLVDIYDKTNDTKVEVLADNTITYQTNNKYGLGYLKTLKNNTIYALTVKYSHSETNNEAMIIALDSNKYGYGVVLTVRNDEVISCIESNNAPFEIRNYGVTDNGDGTYLAKIYLWSGWESDWTAKFGSTSSDLVCNIHQMHLGLPQDNIDLELYNSVEGLISDKAEDITSMNPQFIDGNYVEGAFNDGRITNDKNLVIEGDYSYYAKANTVSTWQPFITSNITLKAGKRYTLTFDYKLVGDLPLTVNIGTSGDFYRAFYLRDGRIEKVDAGIHDNEIGSATTGYYNYLEYLRSAYVVAKDDYNHAKLTFVAPQDGSMIRFLFGANEKNDTYAVIDNIMLHEGIADLDVYIKEEIPVIPTINKLFENRFDEGITNNDYQLRGNAKFDNEQFIAGNNGIHAISNGGWNDFLALNGSLKANTTYTIYIKYRFLSISDGSFAYINLRSNSNVDVASYLGFNNTGVYSSFVNNIIIASIKDTSYYSELKLIIDTADANDINFVIGSSGTIDILFDDLVIYEGHGGSPITDSLINTRYEVIAEETFENGFGLFNEVSEGFINSGLNNVINGQESAYLDATNQTGVIISSGSSLKLINGMTYTMLARVKQIGDEAILRIIVSSNGDNTENISVSIKKGVIISSKYAQNIVLRKVNEYYEVGYTFTAQNQGDIQVTFTGSNGIFIIDDIMIAKNKAELKYPKEAIPENGGMNYYHEDKDGVKPTLKTDIINNTSFDFINITFSSRVGLLANKTLIESVKIFSDNEELVLNLKFNYLDNKVVINGLSSLLVVGDEYKLVVNNFINSDSILMDEYQEIFTYGYNKYNVTFKDYDGRVIDTVLVDEGMAAEAPMNPTREGYNFVGWSHDVTYITNNLEVIALYELKTYTVVFKNHLGVDLSNQTINHGEAAVAPNAPSREGYNFVGWSKEFSNVTSDLEVVALYEEIKDNSGSIDDLLGCTASITTSLIGLISLLGLAVIFKKRRYS